MDNLCSFCDDFQLYAYCVSRRNFANWTQPIKSTGVCRQKSQLN